MIAVFVRHEVLSSEKLIACGDDGGLEVALEGLDGFDLRADRAHGSSKKRCACGADVRVSLGNMELTHVLNARAGRTKLHQVVNDSIVY